jgi:ribonuclease BN (tRNA processing enzyme)
MSRNSPGNVCGAVVVSVAVITTSPAAAQAPPPAAPTSQTQIVLLGTGNPVPDPDRSGPATAVVVNGTPYLVDFGAGVVRRAKAAVVDKGIIALEPPNFRVVFVTHLHSDHTIGYADLILTPWTYGRRVPLEVHTLGWLAKRPDFQAYAARYHTTTAQLAELASQAKPRLLILYHASIALRPAVNPRASSPGELLSEMATRYSGQVVVGRDLDVY